MSEENNENRKFISPALGLCILAVLFFFALNRCDKKNTTTKQKPVELNFVVAPPAPAWSEPFRVGPGEKFKFYTESLFLDEQVFGKNGEKGTPFSLSTKTLQDKDLQSSNFFFQSKTGKPEKVYTK